METLNSELFKIEYPNRAIVRDKSFANDAGYRIDEKTEDYWMNNVIGEAGRSTSWIVYFRFDNDVTFEDHDLVDLLVDDLLIKEKTITFFENWYHVTFDPQDDPDNEGELLSAFRFIKAIRDAVQPIFIEKAGIVQKKHIRLQGSAKLKDEDIDGLRNIKPIRTIAELDVTTKPGFYYASINEAYQAFGITDSGTFTLYVAEGVDVDYATQIAIVPGLKARMYFRTIPYGNAGNNYMKNWTPMGDNVLFIGNQSWTTYTDSVIMAHGNCDIYLPANIENRRLIVKSRNAINEHAGIIRIFPPQTGGSIDYDYNFTNPFILADSSSVEIICRYGNWEIISQSRFKQPVIYHFSHGATSPAGNNDYFIGNFPDLVAGADGSTSRSIICQVDGHVTAVSIISSVTGQVAGNEYSTFTILNNTRGTSSIITNTRSYISSGAATNDVLAAPLRVYAGDSLTIKWDTPAWGTPPTTVRQQFDVKIELL